MRYLGTAAGAATLFLVACGDSTDPQQTAILSAESGSGQKAASLDTLSRELVVRAVDAKGDPIEGLKLVWSTDDHEGAALIPASATTDAQGEVRTRWVLGIGSGTHSADVRVAGGTFSATFSAEALKGFVAASLMESAQANHTCALDSDGRAWCWSARDRGSLGDGGATTRIETVPQPVYTEVKFVSLVGMFGSTCGTTAAGEAWCWGVNGHGIFGFGAAIENPAPVRVAPALTFASLDLEGNSSGRQICGVVTTREAYCWGRGVLGDGMDERESWEPVLVAGNRKWLALARATDRTCGLTEAEEVYCWGREVSGDDNFMLYGIEQSGDLLEPTLVPVVGPLESLSLGEFRSCGVAGATAICWGDPPLGNLDPVSAPGPAVVAVAGVADVDDSHRTTFLLTEAGHIEAWGMAPGTWLTEFSDAPVQLAGEGPWESMEPALRSVCAILKADSTVYCWEPWTNIAEATSRPPRPVPAPPEQQE